MITEKINYITEMIEYRLINNESIDDYIDNILIIILPNDNDSNERFLLKNIIDSLLNEDIIPFIDSLLLIKNT